MKGHANILTAAALLICLSGAARLSGASVEPKADVQNARRLAAEYSQRGDLSGELAQWRAVAAECSKAHDVTGQADALLRVATVCQQLGQFRVAEEALESAGSQAQTARDER